MAGKLKRKSAAPRKSVKQQAPKRRGRAAGFMSGRDVLIQSDDFKDAGHFYETVLGLPVTMRTETMLGFETGSFRLYVEKGPSYGPVFEFFVPDLEAAKQKLVAAGCRVENDDPGVPRCYVRDPFGLIFNLEERQA
jgi:catechol 2,3-dioxygenase-like lactoylglutathione lyase family enzyme